MSCERRLPGAWGIATLSKRHHRLLDVLIVILVALAALIGLALVAGLLFVVLW
jgi:hypothetical protein